MGDWKALGAELDAWEAAGETATLWWRDDDAERPGPALDRLLALTRDAGVPLVVAVVPLGAGPALRECLARTGHVQIAQHGWAHHNHEPAEAKRCELGSARDREAVLADIARGARVIADTFGPVSALVPPWNRIRGDVLETLPALGLDTLSRFGPRASPLAAHGLSQTNTHVDIIGWRARRRFAGTPAVLGALVAHLARRRAGAVDAGEPTGILSHHRVHDEQCWSFLAELLGRTRGHPALRWILPWGTENA